MCSGDTSSAFTPQASSLVLVHFRSDRISGLFSVAKPPLHVKAMTLLVTFFPDPFPGNVFLRRTERGEQMADGQPTSEDINSWSKHSIWLEKYYPGRLKGHLCLCSRQKGAKGRVMVHHSPVTHPEDTQRVGNDLSELSKHSKHFWEWCLDFVFILVTEKNELMKRHSTEK